MSQEFRISLLSKRVDILEKRLQTFDVLQNRNYQERLDAIEEVLYLAKGNLTLKEAAKYLGAAPSYIYRLTSQNKIQHTKHPINRRLYFSREDLDNWMSCKVKNNNAI